MIKIRPEQSIDEDDQLFERSQRTIDVDANQATSVQNPPAQNTEAKKSLDYTSRELYTIFFKLVGIALDIGVLVKSSLPPKDTFNFIFTSIEGSPKAQK